MHLHLPSLPRWLQVTIKVIRRSLHGQITVHAGGIALFAVLAAIPTLAAVVAIYGLISDPEQIHGHLDGLYGILPAAVVDFLIQQLERASQGTSSQLGTALVASLAIAIFSTRNANSAVISGLNNAYGLVEERSFVRRMLTSVLVSVATVVAILLLLAVFVVFPQAGLGGGSIVGVLRWPLLLAAVTGVLIALYRAGPSGGLRSPRRALPGALVATAIWVLVSLALGFWVDRVANYNVLYGAFSGAIVLLLWFYLSALSILIGAGINAELGPSGHRHRWRMSAGVKADLVDEDDEELAAAASTAAAAAEDD